MILKYGYFDIMWFFLWFSPYGFFYDLVPKALILKLDKKY